MEIKELLTQARKHEAALTPGTWTAKECSVGKDCWCKVIESDHPDYADRGVCSSGCIDRNDAESLTWIRNNLLNIVDYAEKAPSDQFDIPRVGIGLAVVKGEEVLLHKRKGNHAADLWSFPGGHLELWESFEDGALRELAEEAGPIEVDKPKFWTSVNTMYPDEGKHYIVIFMRANWVSGEAKVMEPDKNAGWGWYNWNDLPNPLIPGIQMLLDQELSPLRIEQ